MRSLIGFVHLFVMLLVSSVSAVWAQSAPSLVARAEVKTRLVDHEFANTAIGDIVLVFRDGRRQQVTTSGMYGLPSVAPDHETVIWQQFEPYRSHSFAMTRIVVWRGGRIFASMKPVGGWCSDWKFLSGSSQLATAQFARHGLAIYGLYDVASGRLLDMGAEPGFAKMPAPVWAYGLRRLEGKWQPNDVLVTETIQCPTLNATKVALRADGKYMAMGELHDDPGMNPRRNLAELHPGGVRVYNRETGRQLWAHMGEEGGGTTYELCFSPDGKSVAASTDKGVYIWNSDNGALVHHFSEDQTDPAHVAALAWSAAHSLAYSDKTSVHFYSSVDWTEIKTLPVQGAVRLEFTQDGSRFVSADATGIRVWDASEGAMLHDYRNLENPRFALSRNDLLVYSSNAKSVHVVSLSNFEETQPALNLMNGAEVLRLSSDATMLATLEDRSVRIYDLRSRRASHEFVRNREASEDLGYAALDFSADGAELAVCDYGHWQIIRLKSTSPAALSIHNLPSRKPLIQNKVKPALTANIRGPRRWTQKLRDSRGNAYTVFLFANDEKTSKNYANGHFAEGHTIHIGHYQPAIITPNQSQPVIQKVATLTEQRKYPIEFDFRDKAVYVVRSRTSGQPDILACEEYTHENNSSDNNAYGSLYYIVDGKLRQITFKNNGQQNMEESQNWMTNQFFSSGPFQYMFIYYGNGDRVKEYWKFNPNAGTMTLIKETHSMHCHALFNEAVSAE